MVGSEFRANDGTHGDGDEKKSAMPLLAGGVR
jgi:hypothetical protein